MHVEMTSHPSSTDVIMLVLHEVTNSDTMRGILLDAEEMDFMTISPSQRLSSPQHSSCSMKSLEQGLIA